MHKTQLQSACLLAFIRITFEFLLYANTFIVNIELLCRCITMVSNERNGCFSLHDIDGKKSLGRYQVVKVYIFLLPLSQIATTTIRIQENRWKFSCTPMFYRKCMIRVSENGWEKIQLLPSIFFRPGLHYNALLHCCVFRCFEAYISAPC